METRSWSGSLAVGALALALACGQERGRDASTQAPSSPTGDSPVVARLNSEPLTIDDLRGGFPGALGAEPRYALEAVVARRLAAQEARRRGLDATSDAQAQIEALRREAAAREEALLRDVLLASLAAQLTVTEEELSARYEQTLGRHTETRVRLRRASFPSADAARAEHARLGAEGRLDPKTSEEIGPASREQLIRMQMFGLMRLQEPGQRIVVDREGNFALLELVEVLPPEPPPFEEVREQLESEVRAQKAGESFAKLVEDLRAAARLDIDEAVLKDDAAWQPPAGGAAPMHRPWR